MITSLKKGNVELFRKQELTKIFWLGNSVRIILLSDHHQAILLLFLYPIDWFKVET